MWLLDFNQCQSMSMDLDAVDQAVKRFFDDDPYYPRPAARGSTDEGVGKHLQRGTWRLVEQFIAAHRKCLHLPNSFIGKVVETMHIRLERIAEAAKRSDRYSEYQAATEKATPET